MKRGRARRSKRRKEGRQGQITPTSSSMADQRDTWTMSSGGGVSVDTLDVLCDMKEEGLTGRVDGVGELVNGFEAHQADDHDTVTC